MDYLPESPSVSASGHLFRTIVCTCCGHTISVPVYCKDRFCSVCTGSRRRKLRARINALVRAFPSLPNYRIRFITLTIPTNRNARDAVALLNQSFRKLRQRTFWKDKVWGGISVIEITRNKSMWHCHIHMIVLSSWIPQFQLSTVWKSCSGGKICDVRLVKSDAVINYLVAYVSKSEVPENNREELNQALRDSRLYTAFGLAHSLKVRVEDIPFPCPTCNKCEWMPLSVVIHSSVECNSLSP